MTNNDSRLTIPPTKPIEIARYSADAGARADVLLNVRNRAADNAQRADCEYYVSLIDFDAANAVMAHASALQEGLLYAEIFAYYAKQLNKVAANARDFLNRSDRDNNFVRETLYNTSRQITAAVSELLNEGLRDRVIIKGRVIAWQDDLGNWTAQSIARPHIKIKTTERGVDRGGELSIKKVKDAITKEAADAKV